MKFRLLFNFFPVKAMIVTFVSGSISVITSDADYNLQFPQKETCTNASTSNICISS